MKILTHNLDLSGISKAVAGLYPDPPEAIVVTEERLHGLLNEAMPHLNDFEIAALGQQTVRLFGVRLEVTDDTN